MGRAKGAKGQGRTLEVARVLDRLEGRYGKVSYERRLEPMDELVSCILSQHTTDATSFPAFFRLKEKYPSWQDVVGAGPARVASVVKKAGLANQKSRAIVSALKEIKSRKGRYSIDHLADMPMVEAREWLESLPGVGPKTASIVLCFAFGMDAIPVDTHIYRVSHRLGFIDEGVGADKAHDVLLSVVPKRHAYRYHVLLIQHGRTVCKAQHPRCFECELRDLCRFYREKGQ